MDGNTPNYCTDSCITSTAVSSNNMNAVKPNTRCNWQIKPSTAVGLQEVCCAGCQVQQELDIRCLVCRMIFTLGYKATKLKKHGV